MHNFNTEKMHTTPVHTFDYSFLRDMALTPEFADRLARIEGFRNRTAAFLEANPGTARDMSGLAIAMSSVDSNDIEGISTEGSRIFGLLSGLVRPRDHSEYEILGYRDALARIHRDHGSMEVDEDTILDLFGTLVSYTGAEPGYKRRNNEVVRRDPSGKVSMRVKTVPHDRVPDCMFQLIGAYNEARDDMGIPGVLLIPCFVMDFLKIHPFQDGNGRMSRLLTVLMLYHEGFDVCSYVSMESIINKSKGDYYDALQRSGEGWFDDLSDYGPFIDYTVGVLFLAYREMDRRMAACVGRDSKENRVERVLANVSIPISKRELCALMPDISETYVELVVGRMVREGRIERIGPKNSSRYIPRDR